MAKKEKASEDVYGDEETPTTDTSQKADEDKGAGFNYAVNLPTPSTKDIAAEGSKLGEDEQPEDQVANATNGTDRGAPVVQTPHWQALVDIWRILPCQVQPQNSPDWYTVVDVKVAENSRQVVLITEDGKELFEREIGSPVLTRTTDADAKYLH